ncbi:alpha/beta hydrolase [Mycolicibacterium phocaicum]|uniref:Acyl-CoA:diacylglycerol acyltransferase n=1 Tax=Mycolicibacterium phocaicum TaxID=319706 RepID=A0A7I7ZUM2_9MYCO|nr:alpha/beta hydrolase-fold protein [Mycolicibacterium phocaicum]TLH60339.1 alpha/beta hydrolase [Mycolicibacterium phocaicum]BBZ57003.1 hypothetical protein MPHO_39950 [Mycolicibacterium phocaicum]
MTSISRRNLLRAATGLAGSYGVSQLTGCATSNDARAVSRPTMATGSFTSAARGGVQTNWMIARPPGSYPPLRPIIALHGQGQNADEVMSMGVEKVLADAAAANLPPVAVVSVDGGTTYWHKRSSGEDAGAMVLNELLPMLPSLGLATERVAFMGWSMGGYGALLLGNRLGAKRTAAICAVSPALFSPPTGKNFPDGAFDDASEYAANNVWGPNAVPLVPIRIDCGDSDQFAATTKQYIAQLKQQPAGSFTPGGHNHSYWDKQLPDQIRWIIPHLTA